MKDSLRARSLLDRTARLLASESWGQDLNPAQAAALDYLAQANRFSRAPSHVADYLASTRGTVSQSLKALARKGLIHRSGMAGDRRSTRYDVTDAGRALVAKHSGLDAVIDGLSADRVAALDAALSDLLRGLLDARQSRSFGICRSCAHHEPRADGGYCRLLDVPLRLRETEQLCHEHAPRPAA